MKHTHLLFTVLLILFVSGTAPAQTKASTNAPQKSLHISSTPELYSLTLNWVREYSGVNPATSIKVIRPGDDSAADGIEISNRPGDESQWNMLIGHDAIVPVINKDNPMLEDILSRGIPASDFARIINAPDRPNWKSLITDGHDASVNLYVIDDVSVKEGIAKFTGIGPSVSTEILKTSSKQDFISSLQKDRFAVGFSKLSDICKENSNELIANLILLPIDQNSNRRLDYFENIYDKPEDFLRGVWIGKYPDELSGNIYAAARSRPVDEGTLAFLSWILTDGGKSLGKNGYIELAAIEKGAGLNALMLKAPATREPPKASYMWLVILTGFLITMILVVVIKIMRSKKPAFGTDDLYMAPALDENTIAVPRGLFFDKTHTWAFMEKNGLVRIGIDDFMQHLTGKLTRVRMKEPGEKVRKGEKIITIIHEGKQLDIHSPVSGTIREKNIALATDSSMINSSPYADGWVYMIEPMNWLRETEFLLMSEKYKEWLRGEFTRLKEFFATAVRSNSLVYEHLILQDGGQITDNVLADLGPEVWEDFQTKFIDTTK